MLDHEEVMQLRSRLSALREAAERDIGPVFTVSVNVSVGKYTDSKEPCFAHVSFDSVRLDGETVRSPKAIYACAPDIDTALALLRANIAERAPKPTPVIDQQTCEPVEPTRAAS